MPKPVKKKSKKRTPPTDTNQLAKFLVEQTTAERDPTPAISPSALSAYMSNIGRKGGKASGAKRMQNLDEATRSDIALRAATARWDKERAKKKRGK